MDSAVKFTSGSEGINLMQVDSLTLRTASVIMSVYSIQKLSWERILLS